MQKYYEMEEADRLFREAYEIRRAFHPADHPEIAYSLNDMAQMRQQLGPHSVLTHIRRTNRTDATFHACSHFVFDARVHPQPPTMAPTTDTN